jgi:hypothetical protein
MSEKEPTGEGRAKIAERSERLSKALRANLRRRKAQARGRSHADQASVGKPEESKPIRGGD